MSKSSFSCTTKLSISAVIISEYVCAFLPFLCVETSATGSWVYFVVGTMISSNSKICAPDLGPFGGYSYRSGDTNTGGGTSGSKLYNVDHGTAWLITRLPSSVIDVFSDGILSKMCYSMV